MPDATTETVYALLRQLQTSAVRDLLWACFGPLLIDEVTTDQAAATCTLQLTAQRQQWLLQLDQQPEPLLQAISSLKSRRLGIYFELLWHFFIRHDPQLELIAHNLKVYDQQRTLGEIDLVYYCHQRQHYYHLELAIKFYLQTPFSPTPTANAALIDFSYWLGPNCNDRLDKKLARLLQHQITLSTTPQGQAALRQLGIDSVKHEIVIKGYLFYSYGTEPSRHGTAALGKHHSRGLWLYQHQLATADLDLEYWCHLQKPRWLTPVFSQGEHQHIHRHDSLERYLVDYFKAYQQPLLLCGLKKEFIDGAIWYSEQTRLFVTPANWPWSD